MKRNYKFCLFNSLSVFSAVVCSLFVCGYALGASNGCDKEKNNRINQEIALCSVHAYNAGFKTNPEKSAEKQAIRDVIALKTTLITQQLQKQYDFLDATVKRLKTQLQKAVLTAQLEAAGASPSSSGSSSSRSRSYENKGIAGAENCRSGTTESIMSCVSRNIDRISQAINNSDFYSAKQQINIDIATLDMYDVLEKNDNSEYSTPLENAHKYCDNVNNNQTNLTKCVDYMRVVITRNIEALDKQNNFYGYNQGRY